MYVALFAERVAIVTSLNLSDNGISDEGAKALANGNLGELTSLDVCNNGIGADVESYLLEKLVNTYIHFH